MRTTRLLITIACGLSIAGAACNQHVDVLDKTVASPVSPTPVTTPRPPNVDRVTISANAISGGAPLRATATLSGTAPSGGVNVSLSVSDDVAHVEPVVTVPEGSNSVDALISTRSLQGDRQVVLTASTPDRSVTGAFKVYGEAPPIFYQWFSEPGDYIGAGSSERLTPSTVSFQANCERNTVYIFLRGQGIEFWSIWFAAPTGVPLRRGVYENAAGINFNGATTPSLQIAGRGRGCSVGGGRFQVHDIDLQNNRVNRFHASFDQHCTDGSSGSSHFTGDIRLFDATPPPGPATQSCLQ